MAGTVTCRPYRPGWDASEAIAELGRIAAATAGSDLLVLWEEFDLRTSLYGPSEQHPTALVSLQATLHSHYLTCFPFHSEVLSPTYRGLGCAERLRRRFRKLALPSIAASICRVR